MAQAVAWGAEVLVQLGRPAEAEAALRAALGGDDPPTSHAAYWLLAALGEVLRITGQLELARTAYLEASAHIGAEIMQLVNGANLALTELALGRGEEARRHLAPVRRGMGGGGTLFEATVEAIWLAVLAECGEFDDVRALLDGTLAIVEQRGVSERDVAWSLRRAGRRAAEADELGLAVRCVAAALDGWTRLAAVQEIKTCEDALVALKKRGAPVPIGGWELRRKLGAGGMGEVWAAHGSVGAVAVKILHRQAGESLDREVEAAAGLDHPNITALVDLGRAGLAAACMTGIDPEAPILAMELANGGSLAERAGWMSWELLRRALDELLQALAHAHGRGIVHLDIKPENVLIHEGAVKLADFGLARAYGEASGMCGTPPYMAPEIIRGQPVGPAADLYAVGCLAWALASGRLPFEGEPKQVLRQQVQDPLPRLEPYVEVPTGFEGWIGALTEKHPSDRFPSAMAARDALLALAGARTGTSGAHARGVSGEVTWIFDLQAPELPPEDAPRGAMSMEPRPLPDSWRLPRRPAGWAGPALFRFRRWPLVGREEELGVLWEEARRCEAGESRVVAVLGAPRSGRSHLLREFGERLREVGGPQVTLLDGDPFVRRAGLVVYVGDLAHADRYIQLRPIGRARAEELIRHLVPLSRDLRERLLELTDGDPAFLVELLRVWVEQHWLGPSREGLALRPGHHAEDLPQSLRRQALARLEGAAEEHEIAELLAIMGACSARELGRACRFAGLDAPRAMIQKLEGLGLLRHDEGQLHLLPVLRRSLEQHARDEERADAWHRAAAVVVTDPVAAARHLLHGAREAEAAPLLLELLETARAGEREQLARDALVALDRLLVPEDDPRRPVLLGVCLEGAFQRFDALAMAAHTRALGRLDGGHEQVWMGVQAARRQGRLEAAESLLAMALLRPPKGNDLAVLYAEAGALAQCRGDWESAEGQLKTALEHASGTTEINLLVMLTSVAVQRGKPAREWIERAASLAASHEDPDCRASVANARAQIARGAGRLKQAERLYREAASLWSGDRASLAEINLGLVQIERGELEIAATAGLRLSRDLEARGARDFATFALANALPWAAQMGGRTLDDTLARLRLLQRETGVLEHDLIELVALAGEQRPDPRLAAWEKELRALMA